VLLKSDTFTSVIPVNSEFLRESVLNIAGYGNPRNFENHDELNRCFDYISTQLKLYSDTSEVISFTASGGSYRIFSGSVNCQASERIIVGAHYDVCGNTPGADDNASAVAGLIELARLFSLLKPELKYRLDFVVFPLEEPPFFETDFMGSFIHARNMRDYKIDVKLMICLEMIGFFSDKAGSQKYPFSMMPLLYPDRGNFIALVGSLGEVSFVRRMKGVMNANSSVPVYSLNAPSFIPAISLSDHVNYWKFGFDAIMVTDTAYFRNPHYHKLSDTPETLDYNRMAEVIRALYLAILAIPD
jgi:hypothetical protein